MAYFTEDLFENKRLKDLSSSAVKNAEDRSPVKGAAYFLSHDDSLKY